MSDLPVSVFLCLAEPRRKAFRLDVLEMLSGDLPQVVLVDEEELVPVVSEGCAELDT